MSAEFTHRNSTKNQLRKTKMLACLKMTIGNVRQASAIAKVGKSTFYRWLKRDAEFTAAVYNIYKKCDEFAIETVMATIQADPVELLKIQSKASKRLRLYHNTVNQCIK